MNDKSEQMKNFDINSVQTFSFFHMEGDLHKACVCQTGGNHSWCKAGARTHVPKSVTDQNHRALLRLHEDPAGVCLV